MEFEKSTADKSAELSDAQRLSAAAKRIELTPLHQDVAPEALPSGAAADTFGSIAAVPTLAAESEDTSTYRQTAPESTSTPAPMTPNDTQKPHTPSLAVVVTLALLAVATAVAYFYFTR